jgi:hypothetical protein
MIPTLQVLGSETVPKDVAPATWGLIRKGVGDQSHQISLVSKRLALLLKLLPKYFLSYKKRGHTILLGGLS